MYVMFVLVIWQACMQVAGALRCSLAWCMTWVFEPRQENVPEKKTYWLYTH